MRKALEGEGPPETCVVFDSPGLGGPCGFFEGLAIPLEEKELGTISSLGESQEEPWLLSIGQILSLLGAKV